MMEMWLITRVSLCSPYNSRESFSMKDAILRLRPPRIAIFLVAVASLSYCFAPVVRLSPFSCPGCGVAALTAGFGVMMWAWSEFRREKNPICPTAAPVTLVRSGPFRFSRNPMYQGMELMLLAPFLWSGSLFFFLAPAVFFGIIHFIFIPYEEQRLNHTFKEDYNAYRAQVRRWV